MSYKWTGNSGLGSTALSSKWGCHVCTMHDVMTCMCLLHYWPFVRGIWRSWFPSQMASNAEQHYQASDMVCVHNAWWHDMQMLTVTCSLWWESEGPDSPHKWPEIQNNTIKRVRVPCLHNAWCHDMQILAALLALCDGNLKVLIPHTMASNAELWCFIYCYPEHAVEQTVKLLVTPWYSCRWVSARKT